MVIIKNEKYLCIWFKMYKLRDWVDETRLTISLSCNDRAVEYLENHEHLIDNYHIFKNENAIHIIEKRMKYEYSYMMNYNANAVNFLRNNPQYINYEMLCEVEHGIKIIDEIIKNNKIRTIELDWDRLSENCYAMHILTNPKYFQFINWCHILYNKNAAELVKNNLHEVSSKWYTICEQPHLIDLIEQNMDKINWQALSHNYNAIHILEKNINKIHVDGLCFNKNGFNLLLKLHHNFNNNKWYDKNIVFEYFDYCEKYYI